MGTISRSHTFISGEVPTAAQWNVDIDQLFTLVNGNLDGSNVDESGSDGVMSLDTDQTVTGTKTFNEAVITAIEERSAAAGGVRTATAFRHDPASGTAADNDGVEVLFQGDNDNSGELATYGEIECVFTDVSNGSEDSDFYVKAMVAGSAVNVLSVGSAGTIFNQDSADLDFRIETNNIANGFTVDAGLDTFAFGAAAVDDQFVQISTPTATHTATTNTYALSVTPGGAQTIPSGTTTYVGSVNIDEPNITATGTVTNAFTLRISGAPTEGSTSNYALWVDDGATQLDSTLTVGSTITSAAITATDTTAPLILKYDAQEYVTHAVSSAGVYSITTTDDSSDSGAITLDTVDSITLDSDTATEGIKYADGGTDLLRISNSSNNVIIKPLQDAKDIVFQQYDGTEVVRVTDAKGLGTASGTALKLSSNGVAWEFPTADGSADQYLKTDGSGNLDWASAASGGVDAANGASDRIATFTDSDSLNGEANLTFNGSTLAVTGAATVSTSLTVGGGYGSTGATISTAGVGQFNGALTTDGTLTAGGLTTTSSSASLPQLLVENTANDATSGVLKFNVNRGADGADNDDLGRIEFWGYDDGTPSVQQYAGILAEIADASSGAEGGKLSMQVASHDGEIVTGLLLADGDAEDEIDVTIGSGDDSLTSVSGVLSLTKQPCFSAELSSSAGGATGDGTEYTVAFDSERFDQGGDFTNSGGTGGTPPQGTFTAPVSGRYMLTTAMTVRLFSADNSEYYMKFVTSNKTYSFRGGSGSWVVAGDQIVSGTVIADMDATDTAHVMVDVRGSASKNIQIYSGATFNGSMIA